MRRNLLTKKVLSLFVCLFLTFDNAFALNAATDVVSHTSDVNPTTNGNVTNITTTHNIDLYHWSSFNLGASETANYIFNSNGQTALNYLTPGANPSTIYGSIVSSGARGNILLFNPNGIMMGAGASVSGAISFLASTNKFNGIIDGKITFSESEINNALNIGNIRFNDINNAYFVAPNVVIKAENMNTSGSITIKAIGGGEFDVNTGIFANTVGVKKTITDTNIIDIDANIKSNKINIEAKSDSDSYATTFISGEIQANKAVTGENGEIYIIASNDNDSSTAGARIIQNAKLTGESAKIDINSQNLIQNGNIDVSGATGGSVNINANSFDQYGNITAKGTDTNGGNINIKASDSYIATKESYIDVSGKTQGGNISIEGNYQILSSGSYNGSSIEGAGGNIKISAPLTKLYGANIDVSGNTAGGNIYIGGAGTSGIDLQNSYLTMINDGTDINASSINGKGGNVYIDSSGDTYTFGTINTSGKDSNGGYIELCGDNSLNISENIDTGKGGTIYIDPKNIIITDSEIGDICYNMLFTNGTSLNIALDLTKDSNFGSSIAIYNNLLAVGAEGSGSRQKGAAYLFYFDEGSKFANLTLFKTLYDGVQIGSTQLNLNNYGNFGSSIALTNKLLAIGASGGNDGTGEVYLFDYRADSQYANLKLDTTLSGAGVGGEYFGSSLALKEYTSGGTTYTLLAVGAEGDLRSVAGEEFIYSSTYDSPADPYSGLSLITTLTGTHSTIGDNFGSGSALSTITSHGITYGLLAVGASGDIPFEGGAVYLYQFDLRDPSTLDLKLTINTDNFSQIRAGDAFGSSVALLPITLDCIPYNLLAVGAENSDLSHAIEGGRVYYLSFDSEYRLENNGGIGSGTAGAHMGSAIALGQTPISDPKYNLLAVGLDGSSKGYSNAGEIYLYAFDPNTKYANTSFAGQYYTGSTVKGVQSLSSGDLFGWSVALYKNLLAVGAFSDKTGATDAGATYLYSFDAGTLYSNLTLEKKLAYGSNVLDQSGNTYTLTLNAGDHFGSSVALYDGLLAVGAIGTDSGIKSNTGAVYLFNFNSGTDYYPLTIDTVLKDGSVIENITLSLSAGDYFGCSAALYNDLLAVGAEYTDEGSVHNAGAVYLFNFDSGGSANPFDEITLIKKLQSITGYTLAADNNFGNAVSLYENQLAVSAYRTQTGGAETGAVYLFDLSSTITPYDTITLETKLSSVPGYTLYNFGGSLSLYGNLLAVGDLTDNGSAGSVYLFTISDNDYSNPVFNTKLENGTVLTNNAGGTYTLNLQPAEQFGRSVAIYDYLLAIGQPAYSAGSGGAHAGAVYLLNIQGANIGDYTFGSYASDTLYLSPTLLAKWLDTGNLTLQANNNIQFLSSVSVSDAINHTLKLQAGGSITIDDNLAIDLGNAHLVATANENTGTGLVNGEHDSVIAQLTMGAGSSITTTGNATIKMNTGAGKTFLESGDITLEDVSSKNLYIYNYGTTSNSDIIINGILTATENAILEATGEISQTLSSNRIAIAGTTALVANGGNISLDNDLNDLGSTVSVSAGDNANIHDKNGLTMGTTTTGGNLTLVKGANGEIGDIIMDETTVGGNLYLTANNGNISQNTSSGHEITLNDPNGTTSLAATTVTTGTGNINLLNNNNDFTGAISVNADGSAEIHDINGILMGESDITDSLTLTATGNITQNAKIEVGNNTYLNTLGDITLDNSDNDFCYDSNKSGEININKDAILISDYANSATIFDSDNIKIGDINISNGLTLTADGYITQNETKTINIIGSDNTIKAGKYITIYNAIIGTSSSTATLELKAGYPTSSSRRGTTRDGDVPYDLNLVAAEINGVLVAEAVHDINVIEIITGIANGAFSFTAGNDVNIGTLTQSTPTSVITGGADLTVTAGNNFNMIGNSLANPTLIDTDGGDITITANNLSHSGVAEIAMSGNTLIDAGSGNVVIKLLDLAGSTAGTMTLKNITAATITAMNQALTAGTNVILNGILNATGTSANPLVVSSSGGDFINNKGTGALVTDSTQRWLVYTGTPGSTSLNGLTPTNTYYSSTISTTPPSSVPSGNSVLYRTPAPDGGGGSSSGGIIAGATVGGVVAAGGAAGLAGMGFMPGLLLGMASPIQLDESMIDIICNNQKTYPSLVRNIQYVYQTIDICKLDPDKIGNAIFIPDQNITNGSYEMLKIRIPDELKNSPKGVRILITQKSQPFGMTKGAPDINFNVFNTLTDKEINSIYRTRRFLKPKFMSSHLATVSNSKIDATNAIVQKSILIKPSEIKNDQSIVVNYLKNRHFPGRSRINELDQQTYSLIIQFMQIN